MGQGRADHHRFSAGRRRQPRRSLLRPQVRQDVGRVGEEPRKRQLPHRHLEAQRLHRREEGRQLLISSSSVFSGALQESCCVYGECEVVKVCSLRSWLVGWLLLSVVCVFLTVQSASQSAFERRRTKGERACVYVETSRRGSSKESANAILEENFFLF